MKMRGTLVLVHQSSQYHTNHFMFRTLFPGPQAFCKKAVERVNSEKNILNSSVECVEWSGVVFFRKMHIYVHHQIGLFKLINMVYFIFNLNVYFLRN